MEYNQSQQMPDGSHVVMSPTLGKYMNRETIPYWSPNTNGVSRMSQQATQETIEGMVKSTSLSYLATSAAEFVPASNSGGSQRVSMNSLQSGMNSAAAEWTPPTMGGSPLRSNNSLGVSSMGGNVGDHMHHRMSSNQQDGSDQLGGSAQAMGGADHGMVEPMVQVTWNGSSFFVPESMAYAYEGGVEFPPVPEDDVGLEWAQGALSLPAPPRRTIQTIGIPEPVRQHFQSLDVEALRQLPPDDDRYKEIPPRYHSAFALDDAAVRRGTGGSFGYPGSLYKVVDRSDSQMYALRRFDNVRTSPTVLKSALGKWFDVRHPSIVSLHSISQERGALFFTHAFHPAAQTLKQRFLDQRGPLLNEALLWRVLTQLLSGLRVVHGKNMALRIVSPVHVLLTSGTMVRFNCVGIPDVLEFESRKTLTELQIDDLIKLGYLILSLSARTLVGPKNVDQALLLLQQHFSPDLQHVVTTLLTGKSAASQICHMMSERIHDEYDSALAAGDALHSHLRNEYDNGRMLRLLIKLGFMNERPEYAHAPQWSETGDRYVLKLFRDYVFHQCLSDGAPVLDAGHVVSSLNKLDMGDQEQMLLSSRDNKDLLVVSFSDVRRCVESTFIDLEAQAEAAAQQQQLQQQGDPALGGEGYYGGSSSGLSGGAGAHASAGGAMGGAAGMTGLGMSSPYGASGQLQHHQSHQGHGGHPHPLRPLLSSYSSGLSSRGGTGVGVLR